MKLESKNVDLEITVKRMQRLALDNPCKDFGSYWGISTDEVEMRLTKKK